MPKEMFPVIVFALTLVVAILLGNWFLSYVMQRPISEVPNILKVVVHGVSLVIVISVAKKYLVK